MKILRRVWWLPYAVFVLLGLALQPAHAATFNLFQPVSGVLKGNASTYVTTAAASTDVIGMWTGTCTGTTNYLRVDGTCASPPGSGSGTPAGSNTQVQYNNAGAFGADADFTWTAASNKLTLGTLANPGVITTPAATTGQVGPALSIVAGSNTVDTSAFGGALSLAAGDATLAGGIGGDLHLHGGAGNQNGGDVYIDIGDSSTGGAADGEFFVRSTFAGTRFAVNGLGGVAVNSGDYGTAGQVMRSGGGAASATWGAVAATAGGTGLTTVAQGCVLYSSATDTVACLAKTATATRYLSNTGVSNAPAWAQITLTNGVTGILPVANGGTGIAFFTVAGPATTAKTYTFPNANSTIATQSATPSTVSIDSGTYTPTITAVANAGSITAYLSQYMRVGSVVTVSYAVDFTPTAPATLTQLGVTLPIASALTTAMQAAGTCAAVSGTNMAAAIQSDATNDRMTITFTSVASAATSFYCHATYVVL